VARRKGENAEEGEEFVRGKQARIARRETRAAFRGSKSDFWKKLPPAFRRRSRGARISVGRKGSAKTEGRKGLKGDRLRGTFQRLRASVGKHLSVAEGRERGECQGDRRSAVSLLERGYALLLGSDGAEDQRQNEGQRCRAAREVVGMQNSFRPPVGPDGPGNYHEASGSKNRMRGTGQVSIEF